MKYFWRINPNGKTINVAYSTSYYWDEIEAEKECQNIEDVYKWILEVEGY